MITYRLGVTMSVPNDVLSSRDELISITSRQEVVQTYGTFSQSSNVPSSAGTRNADGDIDRNR